MQVPELPLAAAERKVAPASHRAKPAARHHDASARMFGVRALVVSLAGEDHALAAKRSSGSPWR